MSGNQGLIPCSRAVRQLWDYLDDDLPPDSHDKVDRHLAFCRRCCGELEFAKELRAFLTSGGAEEIPPEAKARLERFVADLSEGQWLVT